MSNTLSCKVKTFLNSPVGHIINGEECYSVNGKMGSVIDPCSGKELTKISYGSGAEVDAAVSAADQAFRVWSKISPKVRSEIMHKFSDKLEEESNNIALIESLDVGKPIKVAESNDVSSGIECARYFADLSVSAEYGKQLEISDIKARVHRTPYGVCGFIFPWNFPFLLFMWNVMPAIAAGNTVVIKPSEVTPLSSIYITMLAKEAGIPDGVINVVVGDGLNVGSKIVEHPLIKRMSFTGSTQVGTMVASKCGSRPIPCKLELGGKGAAVVFDDCDLDLTTTELVNAITTNTGQVCCTATRWFVHENIYDEFKEKAIEELSKIRIGRGLDARTDMGPLVSSTQQERVLEYYRKGIEEGANVVVQGGKSADTENNSGYYVTPCLLEGGVDNICYREEIFGPTAYIVKFSDEEKVVDQVNSLKYGLANSIWSNDKSRCQRIAEKLISGNSWINAHNVFAYGLPYAGVNLSGVGGGVNSPETFYDYLRDLTIAEPVR